LTDAPISGVLSDEQVGQRVIFGGAQRAIGFVVANLLTIGAAVVLLRFLGVGDFGRYGTVLALVGVVQGISDAGLTATGSRELALAGSPHERREILAHVLGLRVALTGAGVVLAVGFALVAGYDDEMVAGTALAGVGVFLTSIQSAMLLPLSVELRNGMIAVNDVLRQLVLFVAFIALALADAGLAAFLGAQILVGVVTLLATPVLLTRSQLVRPRWTIARIRALAATALPVAVATVLGVLYLRMLVVLMSLLSDSAQEIGYFVTSTRILEVVGGLPFLVMAVVLPVVSVAARDDRERLVYMTSRITEVMALGGTLVALVVWALARPIVLTLAGPEYGPAVPVLQIQCFAAVTIFLAAAWQPTLFGMGRIKSLAVAIALGMVTVVVSGLVLIPPFEATGAAVAAVVGEAAMATVIYVSLRRAGSEPWVRFTVLSRVAAAAAMAVGVGLVLPAADGVRAMAVAIAFSGAAWMLRTIPSELRDAAGSAATRLRTGWRDSRATRTGGRGSS